MKGQQDIPTSLTKRHLAESADSLATMDNDLARILRHHGTPPLWARKPGFVTLIRIVLEQQVSLASADAVYRRLTDNFPLLTPNKILAAGAPFLRTLGITRQKASYLINVAEAIRSEEVDLGDVGRSDDETAIRKLTSIKGVGPWTAEIYLLMALRRPDVWPSGDIALAAAVQRVKGLQKRPTPDELVVFADAWRPYRATAARMLWWFYLNGRSNGETKS